METILLIENDPATLVAQSLILHSFGYTVLEARSRGEAWRTCQKHPGPIHLVVTKPLRDNRRTRGFIARLRLIHPQIRALFVSEASSPDLASNQSMPCEYAFLRKPFRVDALADTIRGLLDGPKTRAVSSS